jgi:hypothetical protein
VRPPESRLPVDRIDRIFDMASTKITSPRIPYTIEGTPARFLMFAAMNRVRRESRAYSSRYTAAPTPIGNATTATIAIITSEPASA